MVSDRDTSVYREWKNNNAGMFKLNWRENHKGLWSLWADQVESGDYFVTERDIENAKKFSGFMISNRINGGVVAD